LDNLILIIVINKKREEEGMKIRGGGRITGDYGGIDLSRLNSHPCPVILLLA
jgi:hypothetical protein